MAKFFDEVNRLNNFQKSGKSNLYPQDFNLFQNQINQLVEYHFDLFSTDAGSLSFDNHNQGRRGYVSIDISELYENFLKDKTIQTAVDLTWVDSSEINRLQHKLASQSWFLQLQQMVKDYNSAKLVNLCLSVKKAQEVYRGKSLPVFVLQLPILKRAS